MTAVDTFANLAAAANLPTEEPSQTFEGGDRGAADGGIAAGRELCRAREPVATPHPRRDRRRPHHRTRSRGLAEPDRGLVVVLVDRGGARPRGLLPRRHRHRLPPADPPAEPLRARESAIARGRRRRKATRL